MKRTSVTEAPLICHELLWYWLVYQQSAHWQGVREQALGRAENRCQAPRCRNRYQLHVHHIHYRLWEEGPDDVVVLCKPCHLREHRENGAPGFQDAFPKRACCQGGTAPQCEVSLMAYQRA
jgi:HNH endonuclease